MNPATAFAGTLVDELIRCGLRDAVIAPGSRSAPLAMALWERSRPGGGLRLHVRVDERSASFLALGLAKAGGRPVAVACTSGTAAAHFHAAVIEADEAGVPLLVLTADRPPELRGTGANQAIDQLKLYGGAVRWFSDTGVPEARAGMNGYWRSLACRAWAQASGAVAGLPGPVHLNVPLREPLVPGGSAAGAGAAAGHAAGGWPERLEGRPDGAAWTRFPAAAAAAWPVLEVPWTERGVIVCGDGTAGPALLLRLAAETGWPVLAEPSSGARLGPAALTAYPYLLEMPEFMASHRPDIIVSAGRPGLSRGQLALLKGTLPTAQEPPGGRVAGEGEPGQAAGERSPGTAPAGTGFRHIVIAQGPGRWADPARTATDVAGEVRVTGVPAADGSSPRAGADGAAADRATAGWASGDGRPPQTAWLRSWQQADAAARAAVDAVLDAGDAPSEPRLARDLAAALPDGALLWTASSLPVRDLDRQMAPRSGLRVLASRGASGIDGLVSSAIGAALAHHGGPAAAILGDLAFVHDAPGLILGPDEPRPDLALVVVNNNGGGIFSTLEPAAFPESFERLFGTPHQARLDSLAAAGGVPYTLLDRASGLTAALRAGQGGLRVIEVRTGREDGARMRTGLLAAARAAVAAR